MLRKVSEILTFISLCTLILEPSNRVAESLKYAGLVYYEQDGAEDLVTFAAAKKLNVLLEVISVLLVLNYYFLLVCSKLSQES